MSEDRLLGTVVASGRVYELHGPDGIDLDDAGEKLTAAFRAGGFLFAPGCRLVLTSEVAPPPPVNEVRVPPAT